MPGPNVGDGIYQQSVLGLLRVAFPGAHVLPIDAGVAQTFPQRPRLARHTTLARRGFDIAPFLDLDCLCFSGPILGTDFVHHYGPTIRSLRARGGEYFVLSAQCPNDSSQVIDFLRSEPPLAIATRDRPSYHALSSCGVPLYDGVCAAFLVSHTCQPAPVSSDLEPYITMVIDKAPEPQITFRLTDSGALDPASVLVEDYKTSMMWRLLRHLDFLHSRPECVHGYRIIRPLHDIGYKLSHLNFAKPNTFLSYLSEGYLSLYRSTNLTVSDRVHSCAPTLSYGKPALFLGRTPRAAVFDRIGVRFTGSRLMTLDQGLVEREYFALLDWLRSVIPAAIEAKADLDDPPSPRQAGG